MTVLIKNKSLLIIGFALFFFATTFYSAIHANEEPLSQNQFQAVFMLAQAPKPASQPQVSQPQTTKAKQAGDPEVHSMSDLTQLLPNAHPHIVGIGGAGMSAIATVLLERGYRVSGSDQAESEVTRWLQKEGANVFIGHRAENVGDVEMVVVSSAIRGDNPELIAAQGRGIPVNKRAQFLGWLMQGSLGVAVAGTHGKTTTTAMIAHTLMSTCRDPSFIVGGTIKSIGRSAHAGRDRELLIDALVEAAQRLGGQQGRRRAIVVVTGAGPSYTGWSPGECVKRVSRAQARVLGMMFHEGETRPVGIISGHGAGAEASRVGFGEHEFLLNGLAKATGGRFESLPSSISVAQTLRAFSSDLQGQYRLRYATVRGRGSRNVQVQVNRPQVRWRVVVDSP